MNLHLIGNYMPKIQCDILDTEVVFDSNLGLWYRPGRAKELSQLIQAKNKWHLRVKQVFIERGVTRLMNIGAHIGLWSKVVSELGIEVLAYEPILSSVKIARKNSPKAVTTQAVVSTHSRPQFIYIGGTTATSRTAPTRGKLPVKVPSVDFSKVVAKFAPQAVTFDCEGGEYEILLVQRVPLCIKLLDLELHLQKKDWRESLCDKLILHLTESGWQCEYIDKNRNHWAQGSLHSLWSRK